MHGDGRRPGVGHPVPRQEGAHTWHIAGQVRWLATSRPAWPRGHSRKGPSTMPTSPAMMALVVGAARMAADSEGVMADA